MKTKYLNFCILFFLLVGLGSAASAKDEKLEASIIFKSGSNINEILNHTKKKKSSNDQTYAMKKFTDPLIKGLKGVKTSDKYAINNFVVYGTQETGKLSAKERFNLLVSYKNKYKFTPKSQGDWEKVLGLAMVNSKGSSSSSTTQDHVSIGSIIKYDKQYMNVSFEYPQNWSISADNPYNNTVRISNIDYHSILGELKSGQVEINFSKGRVTNKEVVDKVIHCKDMGIIKVAECKNVVINNIPFKRETQISTNKIQYPSIYDQINLGAYNNGKFYEVIVRGDIKNKDVDRILSSIKLKN